MAFCGNCGNQLNEGAKFCPKCGTAVEGFSFQPPRVQSQQVYQPSSQPQRVTESDNGKKKFPQKKVMIICLIVALLGFIMSQVSDFLAQPSQTEKVAKVGYDDGYQMGFKLGGFSESFNTESEIREAAITCFTTNYGTPSSEEEKKLYQEYINYFVKGFREGIKNR